MKTDRNKLSRNLDFQMDIYTAIADRHPKIRAWLNNRSLGKQLKGGNQGFTEEDYNNLCKNIYGSSFPSAFPVWPLYNLKITKEPWYQFLQIDLRFRKDEILFRLKRFVDSEWEKFQTVSVKKPQRKHVEKWVDYLQVWDLKRGIAPDPRYTKYQRILWPDENSKGRAWTFAQIAKFLYKDTAESPEKLSRRIEKVKKQYKAAYKLIFNEEYNHNKVKRRLENAQENGLVSARTCENCPEKPSCKVLCPDMLEELTKFEIKQKHFITESLSTIDIDKTMRSKRKPGAE